jgi:hypothetical protein
MTVEHFFNNVTSLILNPLILLLFAIALLIFFWGLVQFINSETADNKREEGKQKLIWGVVGLFVMFSAYGIIHFILDTFGISSPGWPL